MSVSGIGGRTQATVQRLVDMRQQLDDLQRQLATGKKSTTYAGLGLDSGLGIALRSQLSGLSGFDQTMTTIGVRLDLAQTALTRMVAIGNEAQTALNQDGTLGASGQSVPQSNARSELDELLDLLNSEVDGRYLFSGRDVDKPAVASTAQILDGDGTRAGLKQVIAERRAADLGAAGRGRLDSAAAGGTVTLSEDVAGSPFGFKLASASTDIAGATISGPSGSPPAVTLDLGAATVQPGQSVTFALTLPDGSTETLRLTATDSAPPAAGAFTIGADPTATAANLNVALGDGLAALAGTKLVAASAMAAAGDFFNLDATHVPQRVAGPPFESATALVAATPADTVFWYTGEIAGDPARGAASARVDNGISVDYGLRANEDGIRALVQGVATFAATSFAPTDPNSAGAYEALTERLRPALEGAPGTQKVEEIAAEIGTAQASVKSAQDRHQQTASMLNGLLDETEGVSTEEVATKLLTLQTRLQASLQTTAILYRLNLADYL
jgi:flagellin-like hook-associated protein FlgL